MIIKCQLGHRSTLYFFVQAKNFIDRAVCVGQNVFCAHSNHISCGGIGLSAVRGRAGKQSKLAESAGIRLWKSCTTSFAAQVMRQDFPR